MRRRRGRLVTRVVLTGLLPCLEYKMVVARAHHSVHLSASASSLLFVSRSRRSQSSPRRVLLVSVSPRRRGGHGGRRARGTDARPRDAAAGVRARGRVDDAGGQARVLALGARAPSVRPSIRSFAHRRRLLPRARRRPSSLPRALSDPTTPSPPPSLPRRVRRSSRRRARRSLSPTPSRTSSACARRTTATTASASSCASRPPPPPPPPSTTTETSRTRRARS